MWKGSRTVASARQQLDQPTDTDRIEKRWAEQRLDNGREEDTDVDTNRQEMTPFERMKKKQEKEEETMEKQQ